MQKLHTQFWCSFDICVESFNDSFDCSFDVALWIMWCVLPFPQWNCSLWIVECWLCVKSATSKQWCWLWFWHPWTVSTKFICVMSKHLCNAAMHTMFMHVLELSHNECHYWVNHGLCLRVLHLSQSAGVLVLLHGILHFATRKILFLRTYWLVDWLTDWLTT